MFKLMSRKGNKTNLYILAHENIRDLCTVTLNFHILVSKTDFNGLEKNEVCSELV